MIWRQSPFAGRQLMDFAEVAVESRSAEELWPELMGRLERLVGFDAGFIASTGGTADSSQGVVVGHDVERLRSNVGRYLSEISPAEVAAYTDRARRDDELWTRARRRGLSIFNELMSPAGTRHVAVRVSLRQGVVTGFNLERRSGGRPFRDRELALLDAVAPIVQMADALMRQARRAGFADWASERGLTTREREIAGLVTRGLRNAEIAGVLGLSPFTVRNALANVFEKADVSTRAELTFAASQAGQDGARARPADRRDQLTIFHERVRRASGP